MAWTDERVELLKKLWGDGLSASQIAARLGEVTRNAVIGKVHRLGLSGRATTSRMKSVRPRKKMARPRVVRGNRGAAPGGVSRDGINVVPFEQRIDPAARAADELDIPLHERKTIETLKECSCRWPIGDPTREDFHFCGRNKVAGLPYCEFHARKAFQPVQPRRRERDDIVHVLRA